MSIVLHENLDNSHSGVLLPPPSLYLSTLVTIFACNQIVDMSKVLKIDEKTVKPETKSNLLFAR